MKFSDHFFARVCQCFQQTPARRHISNEKWFPWVPYVMSHEGMNVKEGPVADGLHASLRSLACLLQNLIMLFLFPTILKLNT